MVSVAVNNVHGMESIIKESNGSSHTNSDDPYEHYVSQSKKKIA